MLIETIDGTLVNADFVVRWEPIPPIERKPGAPSMGAWALLDANGSPLGATDTDPDAASFAWSVVPAYPGFRVLHVAADEAGQQYVEEHQIIAWRIPAEGALVPITLAGIPAVTPVIASPTDRIVGPDGSAFANQAAWFAAHKDAHATIAPAHATN